MKLAGCCLTGAVLAFVTSTAMAEDPTSRFGSSSYLGALGGYTFADDDRADDIDHASGLQLFYGSFLGDAAWGYEISGGFDIYETDSTISVDYYRYTAGADLTYSFGDRDSFTPFLIGGIAADYNDVLPDDEDDWAFLANAGVGFVTGPLTKRGKIRFRGELRYVYDDFQSGYGEPRINLGIELPLLQEREAPPPQPQEAKVVEVPTGLLDSDGDGIIDDKDECPDTAAGVRVDGVGCALPKIIDLKGVTFEFNETRLRPDAETILDWAAGILKKYPDMQVEVAGHTDSLGSEEYNQKLSEGRAQAVHDYFVEHGIPAEQMSVHGYGESQPRDNNETEAGRERNRRVELRVLN